jgi:hypothetical protein
MGKMICLGKNRTVLAALLVRWSRGIRAIDFPHSLLRRSVFILAGWIILLAAGTAWAGPCSYRGSYRPCPEQTGYWRAAGWYQAGRGTPDNGGRNIGVQISPPSRQSDREHLGEWLQQHQNMSFAAQERALRTEPGFNRLPPARQQRLLDRLQQLDAMPPAQRTRTLERLETWERLSPEQRQQVRIGIQQVRQMPFYRQQMIHRAVRDLSEFPPAQRFDILNSWEFRHRYSDYERQVLATLMLAQPYEPLRPQ